MKFTMSKSANTGLVSISDLSGCYQNVDTYDEPLAKRILDLLNIDDQVQADLNEEAAIVDGFAGQAMAALLALLPLRSSGGGISAGPGESWDSDLEQLKVVAFDEREGNNCTIAEVIAGDAYAIAEAMLDARCARMADIRREIRRNG